MKTSTRLAGHGLRNEGRIYLDALAGYVSSLKGRAVCECGARSEFLPNANQRRKWHSEHKKTVRRPR